MRTHDEIELAIVNLAEHEAAREDEIAALCPDIDIADLAACDLFTYCDLLEDLAHIQGQIEALEWVLKED